MTRGIIYEWRSNQMKNKLSLFPFFLIILTLLLTTTHSIVLANSDPNLQIINLSGATFNFSYDQLLAMPKTTVTSDLFCNGVLKTTGDWGGVSLNYLLTQAQISPDVLSIDFNATDNYRTSIPISLAMTPQIIIAYDKNNQPLNEGLRLILPGINGPVWIASISSIAMSSEQVANPPSANTADNGVPVIPLPSYTPNELTPQQQTRQPTPTILQNQPTQTTTLPANTNSPSQAKAAVQPSSHQNQLLAIVLPFAFALLVFSLTAVFKIKRTRNASAAN
jgi:DMSO/TMAO reductase YedYZ molybdopterin-dependent catalytic subunit